MTRIELPEYEIVGIRANNPGPFTLTGTNSWIVGRDPAWLVDPGPALDDHVEALAVEIERRGGLGGIALTHDHADHAEAVHAVHERFPDAPLAAARGEVDVRLEEGSHVGPFKALHAPGHALDHYVFVTGAEGGVAASGVTGAEGRVAALGVMGAEGVIAAPRKAGLTGDAVLGEGSVFIYPDPGALAGYLDALGRLRRDVLTILCPGHGPLVHDVAAKLDEYIAHRLERERRLVAALDAGKRSVQELLADVWDDAPEALLQAATVTLAAHLDKLADEGRLPDGVERPRGWGLP